MMEFDGNVLGFYPKGVKTYDDITLRTNIAKRESNSKSMEDAKKDPQKWKIYRYFTEKAPMATEYDERGNIKKDKNGRNLKGIEDYLPSDQYNKDEHRQEVVKDIISNFDNISGVVFFTTGTYYKYREYTIYNNPDIPWDNHNFIMVEW